MASIYQVCFVPTDTIDYRHLPSDKVILFFTIFLELLINHFPYHGRYAPALTVRKILQRPMLLRFE
jgi:hypothetical protein